MNFENVIRREDLKNRNNKSIKSKKHDKYEIKYESNIYHVYQPYYYWATFR